MCRIDFGLDYKYFGSSSVRMITFGSVFANSTIGTGPLFRRFTVYFASN